MSTPSPLADFLTHVSDSLRDSRFIALTLGHYAGTETDLKQVLARPIAIKKQLKLSVTYRYRTRDIVKNYLYAEAMVLLEELLASFRLATLYTRTDDWRFDAAGKKPTLKRSPPTRQPAPLTHDRAKERPVAATRPYLQALRITDARGEVYKAAQDKYRQINKYIEILGALVKDAPVSRVADMGAGKGYLTFALYDHLAQSGMPVRVTGVEYRADLVAQCNGIAHEAGFTGLDFVEGSIAGYDATGIDLLIALHACDTATDDAIAKGIRAGARHIVVAPCCHKQIRHEMDAAQATTEIDFITRHGTYMERQAEMVTDSLRVLMLEAHGYRTKLFEFISDAHTPKNVMIVATLQGGPQPEALARFQRAKAYFGIRQHYLETLLPA